MQYTGSGAVQDCPKCKFSLERLSESPVLDQRSGIVLDDGLDSTGGWRWFEPDDNLITSTLFGSWDRYIWRRLCEWVPWLNGRWSSRRYQKILKEYPNSLICTHCRHLIKRK